VGYSITHKGTDFRAVEGTPVLAMNRGVVRLVQEGRNYGKTVIIDHGLGLQTFYMHLSKINVKVGELVLSGQIIGLSGMTGYAEAAHLHTTVRIGEVSIDPVRFLGLFDI
jgi:murein DD-endopeptidase MepM/ murein hydrolase activator NlpD